MSKKTKNFIFELLISLFIFGSIGLVAIYVAMPWSWPEKPAEIFYGLTEEERSNSPHFLIEAYDKCLPQVTEEFKDLLETYPNLVTASLHDCVGQKVKTFLNSSINYK